MYAEPAEPTCAGSSSRPEPSSVSRPPMAPTIVTARPSRIHTVPSPMTTIQCHLDHGNRSIRAGMSVSIVRSVTPSAARATRTSPTGLRHDWATPRAACCKLVLKPHPYHLHHRPSPPRQLHSAPPEVLLTQS